MPGNVKDSAAGMSHEEEMVAKARALKARQKPMAAANPSISSKVLSYFTKKEKK